MNLAGISPVLTQIAAVAVFLATYLVVAVGRVPGLHIDRAGAAFLGAALMVACGALSLEDAYRAVDWNTIALLLGMMIVVANLRLSGFFGLVTASAVRRAGHPLLLLAAVVVLTGVLSAFLVNDTICLVLTPLVLRIVLTLKRNPVPYLIAVALAANVGGVATITGNPQNMIVGSLSGIPYASFARALGPVAGAGMLMILVLVPLVWRQEFAFSARLHAEPPPFRTHDAIMRKTLVVTALLVVAFFWGVPPAEAALVAGGVLLVSRRLKVARMYAEIDWTLLVMFAGLFIVVAGLEHAVLTPDRVRAVGDLHLDRAPVLAIATAILSNLVSNVPAVLVLKPFVAGLHDQTHAWLLVAMASTLAGNFSILGSVANLIVVQRARAEGVEIGFWTYFMVGAPLTVASIAAGLALLG
jgi:Na+/H+ antiporter NhaD/arsenite permease-like protein